MSESIIIDEYHRRPLLDRLLSEGATTALWGSWFWLLRINQIITHNLLHNLLHLRVFLFGIPSVIEDPAVALVSTTSVLMLWNSISNTNTKASDKPINYAQYFGLEEKQLEACKQSQVCKVHHDEFGRITKIEC
jgi:poly-beta-1,6-N-acetyl-D-glucosamine biosynthesis protein PgaD